MTMTDTTSSGIPASSATAGAATPSGPPAGGATAGGTTAGGTTTPGTPSGGQPAAGFDATFVQQALASGFTETSTSQLALERSDDPDVRAFAQRMIDEHTDQTQELLPLVQQAGLQPNFALSNQQLQTLVSLNTLQGTEFDTQYIESQIQQHTQAIELFRTEATQGRVPQLQDFVFRYAGDLLDHREAATDISQDLQAAQQPPATEGTGTETTGTETTGTETTGTETTGTETTGTEDTGTETTGTEATGTEATGTEATATEATGTEATGTEDTGTETTGTEATATEDTGTETTGTEDTGTTGTADTTGEIEAALPTTGLDDAMIAFGMG